MKEMTIKIAQISVMGRQLLEGLENQGLSFDEPFLLVHESCHIRQQLSVPAEP